MASPHALLRARVPRAALVLGLATAGVVSILPAAASQADPQPTLAQVEARVNALNDKVDQAVEAYSDAKIALAAATRKAAVANARVAAAQAELTSIQQKMGSVAAEAYRSGGADQFVQLVSDSTPETFLDRATSLDRIAAGQSVEMALAATARSRLANVQAEANHEKSAEQTVAKQMKTQKATIESALAQEQALLSSLKAQERARLRAAEAAERRQAAAEAAAEASRSRAMVAYAAPTATYDGPASGQASVALAAAYAELGKPYQWGAAGPSSFDCSGLTMWSWGKAGVSLPHSSQAQYAGGLKVSQADLQPGDLVFFGSPIHHVGMYVGNGNMIDAPETGDVVRIQPAFRSDYAGAVRP